MLISALAWRTISPSRSTLTLSRVPVSVDLRLAADIELLVAAFDVDALLAAAGFVALEALAAGPMRGVSRLAAAASCAVFVRCLPSAV